MLARQGTLPLEPVYQLFVLWCLFFHDRISRTICWGWLPTTTLLISASWVTRITCVSHQHPPIILILKIIQDHFCPETFTLLCVWPCTLQSVSYLSFLLVFLYHLLFFYIALLGWIPATGLRSLFPVSPGPLIVPCGFSDHLDVYSFEALSVAFSLDNHIQ
jgi:hypothetical protein